MVYMQLSERANLIFNYNGSIIVRHAFKSRDGKFHDIVVTDGDNAFRKEDWVGCHKVLLNKIWTVYSTCIQEIQKREDTIGKDVVSKIVKEQVRFVYKKKPTNNIAKKTKLFINSTNNTLHPQTPYEIGHFETISKELEILNTFLWQPHTLVLPPKSTPDVKTKTPKKTTKAVEPKKSDLSTQKLEKSKKPANPDQGKKDDNTKATSSLTLPPIKPHKVDSVDSNDASIGPHKNHKATGKLKKSAQKIVSRGMAVLGPSLKPGALIDGISADE